MKNIKRLLAVVLTLAMLVPTSLVSVFADSTADNWNTFAAKYDSATGNIINDVAGFSFNDNAEGGIDIVVPSQNEVAGTYPIAMVSSKYTTTLAGLTVTLQPDDDFDFSLDGQNKASPAISMLWTKTAVNALSSGTEGDGLYKDSVLYTNGLRALAGENGVGLAVTVDNSYSAYNGSPYASNLSITLFDGEFYDEVDAAYGFEWEFTARNGEDEDGNADDTPQDKSKIEQKYCAISVEDGLTVYVREDSDLGYVVVVNGNEYYKGTDVAFFPNDTGELESSDYVAETDDYTTSMTYAKEDIDLSDLVGVKGYLSFAVSGNYTSSADLTVDTINGVPAAQWKGEALGEHEHHFVLGENKENTCLEDGFAYYSCECGAHYSELFYHPGHRTITYDSTPNSCTEDGMDHNRCVVCGYTEDVVIAASGHKWGEYEVSTRATAAVDGVMIRKCENEGCDVIETKSYKYSDADDISDNWYIQGENRYNYFNNEYQDGIVFTTVNDDGSITLKDTMAQYADGKSWCNITKITSTHVSHLDGFTATVEMLPANDTNNLRPDSVSFIWFNLYDHYRFAGQYSAGTYFWFHENEANNKKSGSALNSTKEDSRLGYMFDSYVEGEMTYNITLNDDCFLWNQYQYGVADDNMYDFVMYTSVCRGDLWDSKIIDLTNDAPIDATQPITVGSIYEYSEDDDANILAFTINDELYYASGLANSQTYDQIYYFGVAAYGDGVNKVGASFTLTDVCGEKPVDFDGYTNPDTLEHEHVWSDWEWEYDYSEKSYKIAECNKTGRQVKYCECGASEYKKIPRLDHTFETMKIIKEPTCVEPGEATAYCVGCTHVEDIVLEPTGVHVWSDWTVTEEATATKHGEGERYCLTCLEKETVIHVWEDEEGTYTKYPTCAENGTVTRHCVVCDEDFDETVAATGVHYWGEWVVTKKSDCGHTGTQIAYCMMCDASLGDYVKKVGEHVWDEGVVKSKPKCTTAGSLVYTCTNCGDTKTESIPPAHNWDESKTVTVEATCTSDGSISKYCRTCRKTIVTNIAGGHTPVDEVAIEILDEPTCTSTGSKKFVCAVCNEEVVVPIPVVSHTLSEWIVIKAPTCFTKGQAQKVCTICNDVISTTSVDPEHSYGKWEVISELTCSTDFLRIRTCTECGEVQEDRTRHRGHNGGGVWNVIKEPTCIETGEKTVTCIDCGEIFTYHTPVVDHTWSDWETVKEATKTEVGEQQKTCTVCGEVETAEIPVLPDDKPTEYPNPFIDVKEGKWYTEGILWCNYYGYMNGVSETVFDYKGNVTRAMFVTILAKIDGADTTEYEGKSSFNDVATGKWYSNAIEWAYRNEYTTGFGEGIFGYKNDVTREQLAQFFYNYSEKKGYDVSGKADLSKYSDLNRVHAWALEGVEWAVEAGLISGTSDTTLAPRDSATRAEISLIVKNYVETIVK